MKRDVQDLELIRIFEPALIPRHLIEQIKERDFTPDDFYTYLKLSCLSEEKGKMVLNPLNLLFVLADKDKRVMGFIWAIVDPLNKFLCINNFSIDRRYWGKGKAIALLKDWAIEIQKGAKLKKIIWISKHTKYHNEHGFKESRSVLYEYVEEKEDGENVDGETWKRSGEIESSDSRTTELSKSDARRESRSSSRSDRESATAV